MNIKIENISNVKDEIVRFSELEMKYFETESFQKAWESYVAKNQELSFSYLKDGDEVIGLLGWIYDQVEKSTSLRNAGFDTNLRYTWLMAIAVDKEYRGKGLSNKLMEHWIEDSKKSKADILALRVAPSNVKAIKLYEKFGFTEYDRSENSVMMFRKI